ncbi:uncharacterized protein N7459_005781 [Penicillium hispanicum]|uniref:uncharacterized protein n=1 Tax=Penicillium hispanicum TaxID=1080232 RepID=UPI0025413D0A|nr:uncharacterized protein N7459_005781 [Penicillium hispanicum]KAJ5579796.1 hypothetical protein N7459_005781 [Penicillium hispanicum]
MAITELIFPSLKTDKASIDEVERNWPAFSKQLIDPNPGLFNAFRGWVLSEGDKDVRGEYKEFLLFEWKDEASFHAFFNGEQFAKFRAMVGHLLTGPPALQLYNTNVSPKVCGLAPVVEIIRVPVSDAESVKAAERAWEGLSEFLVEQPANKGTVTYGKSLNLEGELFAGIIGWASAEDRSEISKQEKFQQGLSSLGSLGEVSHIMVDASPMDLPVLQEA